MMNENNLQVPPILMLTFRKGDLIFRSGDYGASIYRLVTGEVETFIESDFIEMVMDVIEPGEIFGEDIFASRGLEPRSISARAAKESKVEIWHVDRLLSEYDDSPTFLRHVLNQPFQRMKRAQDLIHKMEEEQVRQAVKHAEEKPAPEKKAKDDIPKRSYYRKDISEKCSYYPAGKKEEPAMLGTMVDISMGGAGIEVADRNLVMADHAVGSEFMVDVVLPGDRSISFLARVMNVKDKYKHGRAMIGLSIIDISYDHQKKLGFFLMP